MISITLVRTRCTPQPSIEVGKVRPTCVLCRAGGFLPKIVLSSSLSNTRSGVKSQPGNLESKLLTCAGKIKDAARYNHK